MKPLSLIESFDPDTGEVLTSTADPMIERSAVALYGAFIMATPRKQMRGPDGRPMFFGDTPIMESERDCVHRRWNALPELAKNRWRAEAAAALEAA